MEPITTQELFAEQFAGPVVVTLVYFAIYYAAIVNVLRVKVRLAKLHHGAGKAFDRYFGHDRELLAADRIQLNMLEHMPIFLVLLWIHACTVSPQEAAILGAIYLITRAIYPLLLPNRLGRNIPNRVLFATFPGYAVLGILGVRILMALV